MTMTDFVDVACKGGKVVHYPVSCSVEELQWNWPWTSNFKILFTSLLSYRCQAPKVD